tara:strand:+ start:346 stop:453 length:108 start_codon:yes stop_codon:yes gene_type:complete
MMLEREKEKEKKEKKREKTKNLSTQKTPLFFLRCF